MNENELLKEGQDLRDWENADCDESAFDLDALESQLQGELDEQLADLSVLEEDRKKIGNPESLGNTIKDVVWEQFCNQIGVSAGEDFIKENRGLKFDPRDKAHIQTTENFKNGEIASHNSYIDYQQRYDDWQANFQHDENGNVETHSTRTGTQEATLVRGARGRFDSGRPTGSTERGTDMDHTISAGEIIRDPEANAHLTREEQVAFANSDANLNEMDASQNRSKGDKSMTDWLDNPNSKGQKPDEIFDISEEQDRQYRKKDAEAREEYERVKKEGEQRSIETGKQSQKEEAFRMGGKALRSVVMGLLAELVKDIIGKLVLWLRSANKKFSTFIDSVKEGIKKFFSNLKQHLKTAGDTLFTTIATAVIGPIIGMIKKAWIFLKQGYNSVKEAIKYLKNPENKNLPFSLKMLNVGKILIAGLTASGAIGLGEVIEKGLLAIPAFAIQIPLLGSLASIIGIFLGAIVSGIIGALALRLIDKLIAKRLERLNTSQQIDKRNEILSTQEKLIAVNEAKMYKAIDDTMSNVSDRHKQAGDIIRSAYDNIMANSDAIKNDDSTTADEQSENKNDLDDLFDKLAEI